MSGDGIQPVNPASDAAFMVDYVKIRPLFNTALVVRGKDDVRTAEIPDVVVSISAAARAALDGLTAQQINEIGKYREPGAGTEVEASKSVSGMVPAEKGTPAVPQAAASLRLPPSTAAQGGGGAEP
ncbi:hypothetical protein [Stakelama tenebrarum]|uniref:Uncharacterized protein n=1 Tax=Stakelama tenebrarum TaxID=2711215 RepID=A0A6G6Y7T1_9SPHN|nr:hypothetical protein [Sphingosinithalassobacter tenebrarum]QIG80985.1 hypothetical protein G5C33_15100 [Sphingosinithalassobacter tenebrarum]